MKKLTIKEIKNIKNKKSIEKLLKIIKVLRHPEKGCPWDLKQNYLSLSQYPIEEAYELQNAVEKNDIENIKEELGDLLLQVVLYSQVGNENKDFNFDVISNLLSEKLMKRHPQIFDIDYEHNDTPEETWEKIKIEEKNNKNSKNFKSILSDIPKNLPPIIRSLKIQKKASSFNFDWDNSIDVLNKIDEELNELKTVINALDDELKIEDELGDLLFTIINLSRHLKLDPNIAFNKTIKKFENRFSYLEKQVYDKKLEKNKVILEKLWNEAKFKEE